MSKTNNGALPAPLASRQAGNLGFENQLWTAAGLQRGWNFVIPDRKEQAGTVSDFELVTWLAIKVRRS